MPSAAKVFDEVFRDIFRRGALAANHESDLGFDKINYEQPEKLGIDRLVAAFAAREQFGAPCIVGDFGTATTIDAVDRNNVFRGGIIAPGMRVFADAPHHNTAQLPIIKLEKPADIFGTNTIKSIQAGAWFGYPKMVDALITQMSENLAGEIKIVATGGLAQIIVAESEIIEIIEPDLILEGLAKIYKRMNK